MDSRAQHFVICWFSTIFFLSYYFLESDEFIFPIQDTHNNQLKERYGDDSSTSLNLDPDLWLKAKLSNEPDRNWLYRLSNIMIENLRTTHSASTIGCLQLIPNTLTSEFTTILDQRVHAQMTHLSDKYERLITDYEEPRQLIMEMR